jgi:RAP1 GTPase activating protein 1
MLYGIQTGFGSPQVPVAELLARPAPSLHSPQNYRPKSSNFLQVPDIESRPKSVPSSPMVKRAFSRLGTITAGWGRSIRSKQHTQLNVEDKKKWASSQDCSGKAELYDASSVLIMQTFSLAQQIKTARIVHRRINPMHWQCLVSI